MIDLSGVFSILIAILIFGMLVISHEFGHFFIAKKNGIYVEEFAVGMGPKLISKQIGETLYSIRAIPFGGFCRMLGEDASSDDNRAFNNKSPQARMAVVAAGPIMNFIFAFVLILILNLFNGSVLPVIDGFSENSTAMAAGIEKGDRIVSINGQRVNIFYDMRLILDGADGSDLEIGVKKQDSTTAFYNVKPVYSPEIGSWAIGIAGLYKSPIIGEEVMGYERLSLGELIHESFFRVVFFVKSTVIGFIRIISFNVNPEEIAGPIGMVEIIDESYNEGLKDGLLYAVLNVLYIAALFSANLGALNLFPIPAMDGGRLVFLFVEKLRGKPIDPNKEGLVHFAGFVILMGFMAIVALNDIKRIFM